MQNINRRIVMCKEKIREVMYKIPTLGIWGIIHRNKDESHIDFSNRFQCERDELLSYKWRNGISDFDIACEWLKNINKIKSINKCHDSYEVKSLAENNGVGYVTNGMFIVAAIYSGFMYSLNDNRNVNFNFSERSINALKKGYT